MSLEDNLSKLSLYDAKKYFRRAQNVVFNYTEMEAKVREATNNEPWGASSTLMEKIAQGTYNFREREEILGMIFRRFTEKTASEWRQIYKALQLLEYLIKHGSERFIDDVRTNLNLVKMLESFHYIDSQGRDQGINVRNRANQLVSLLESDEQIREQRKKARETLKKYKGVAGGSAAAFGSSINSHAGFTKSTSRGISVSADYDSDDDESYQKPLPYGQDTGSNHDKTEEYKPRASPSERTQNSQRDLFSLEDTTYKGHSNEEEDDEDDFADFQSATPSASAKNQDGLDDLIFSSAGNNITISSSQIHIPANVTPAIANVKPADPFGSLFSSAKSTKYESAKPINKSEVKNTPKNQVDDDDDLFGDLQPAPNKVAKASQPAQQKNNTLQSNEIDLLSF